LQQKLKKQNIAFNDVDGIRVDNNDGWWLLRASNTQPVIVARCESNSIEGLDRLKSNLSLMISEFNLKINF
jgi:phosphomannomutase